MKNKKGFTLVELLAVLVIIGIISTITVPIIMEYIDTSKEKSIASSLNGIERASLNYFTSENVRNIKVVDLKSGIIEIENNDITKGLVVGNRDSVKLYIYRDNYCAIKNGDDIIIKKTSANQCSFDLDNSIEVVSENQIAKDKKIVGYRIYGNTVDNYSLGDTNKILTIKLVGKNKFNVKGSDFVSSVSTITTYNNGYRLTMKDNQTANSMNTLSSYLFDLDNGKYTICAQTNFEGTFYKADGGTPDNLYPVISIYNHNSVTGNKYQYNSTKRLTEGYFSYINFEVTDENKVGYLRIMFNNLATVRTYNTQGIIWNIQILPGTITTLEQASYEPYLEPKEYNINLKEPLRSFNNTSDYIDSSISQIVRQVGVNADGSLYALDKPIYEYIKLPTISNLDGTTIISASDGSINASKIQLFIAK